MPPIIALIGCIVFVSWLLLIERQRNPAASYALWVPTFWMLICGSKPVARWFESGSLSSDGGAAAGSPLDRLVLSILILLALLVLFRRKIEWSRFLKNNFWLIFLYLYLGFSILWSDHPSVSMRRWIRILGAIPVALVVLSERSPLEALESVLRRCAYVLVPFSLLTVKYFPLYGVVFNRWSGQRMWIGVAVQKNGLGQLCGFSAFIIIWAFLRERRAGGLSKNRPQTFADGLVFAIAVFLLVGPGGCYSATSIGILIVGIASLLLLYQMENRVRHMVTYLVCAVVVVMLCLYFTASLMPAVTSVFGRDESFTGRTDIWRLGFEVAARHPILGRGFGGYWGFENEISEAFRVTEGHNGFLDVYIELGMVGIVILFGFLLSFYVRVRRELNHAFDWAVFGICFLVMLLINSYTESNYLKTSSYLWNITVFLTVVFSAPCLHKSGG